MTLNSRHSVHYRLLVFLIVAASCLRIFLCFQHNPMDYLWSDMQRHWHNGLMFPRGGYTGAADPIVYQAYLFVLQKLTASNRYLIALASALLSILMPWTYYRAARDFGLGKIPSLWVWTLIAWTPSLFAIYQYLMMETMLLCLEGIALWMTARYLRKGGTLAFLLSIFCWTLAALTKPTIIPLAGVCVLWSWWKKSTPLRDIAVGALLAVIMLVPQAVRSKVGLGFMAPFGNPWLTRIQLRSRAEMIHFHYYAYSPDFLGFHLRPNDYDLVFGSPSCFIHPLLPLSDWAMERSRAKLESSVIVNSAYGQRDWKAAYAVVSRDPEKRWTEWRENIVLFFFAQSWPDSNPDEWDGWLDYQIRWLCAPLILLVLAGNLREFLHRRFDLVPIATTIFTLCLALQNAVIMEGRYRKPIETVLLLNLVWLFCRRWSHEESKNEQVVTEVAALDNSQGNAQRQLS